jgi:histone H3/H4
LRLSAGSVPIYVQDIPIVAKEATFLISLATEEFIKRLIESSQKVAEREKRATVQHRDIGP